MELNWLLSVFCHVDASASPELHFAGAHHHIGLLQGCWGSELGSLCSHANATGLKAMGPNDPARQEKTKPSLYILTCLRYFVVVAVMENGDTAFCQLYLSEGGGGGQLEGLRPAHSWTVIKLCEKQRLHL